MDIESFERTVSFGDHLLLPRRRLLLRDDVPVRLGSRAMDILVALVEQAGTVVTKEELIRRVWPETFVEPISLRVHVAALRKALSDGQNGRRYIQNVPQRGYIFVASIALSGVRTEPCTSPAENAHNLPPRLTRLIGRDSALVKLTALLSRQRLISIVGPGGIGKTTVALRTAELVISSFSDGIHFVDLSTITEPALVRPKIASALGLITQRQGARIDLAMFLRDKQALLLIDSCEHLLEDCARVVEELLRACPALHILATSREPLRAEGEQVFRLAPLALPAEDVHQGMQELGAFAAVQLFVERAVSANGLWSFQDSDAQLIAEICRRLDGIPLAIELAAAHLDVFGLSGLLNQLNQSFRLKARGRRTALPRQQTLSATLDWSHALLTDAEQACLRRLGIFRSQLTLEAAVAVLEGADCPRDQVPELISQLVAKSLLQAEPSEEQVRYRLLDITRAYAREKLAASGELQQISKRHALLACDIAELARNEWEQIDTSRWLARYGCYLADIRAALDWAFAAGQSDLALRLTAHSSQVWLELALFEEHMEYVNKALTHLAGHVGDPRLEFQLHLALASSLYHCRGAVIEAGEAYRRAFDLADRVNEPAARLKAATGLYSVSMARGDYETTLYLAQRSQDIKPAQAAHQANFISGRMLALAYSSLGNQRMALQHSDRVMASFALIGPHTRGGAMNFDQRIAATTTHGRLLWLQGRFDEALDIFQTSVPLAAQTGHVPSLCYCLSLGACPVALWAGEHERALEYFHQLRKQTQRYALGYWKRWAQTYSQVRLFEGLEPELQAVDIRHHDLPQKEFLATLDDGYIFPELAQCAMRGEARWVTPELLRLEAVAMLGQGKYAPAQALLLECIHLARTQHARFWVLRASLTLAEHWQQMGRPQEAYDCLASIYQELSGQGSCPEMRTAQRLLIDLSACAARSTADGTHRSRPLRGNDAPARSALDERQ